MTAALAVACAVAGLLVGSFLNVVIHRVPMKESVIRPRSRCPACDTEIANRDNVPVVSWLLLRGRCRSCGARIPVRYPLVEVGTAGLFAAAAVRFGTDWALPAFLALFAVLLAVTVIDLQHYIVPNRIVFPTVAVAVPLLALAAVLERDWRSFGDALAGGAIGFVGLLAVNLVYPRGMGMGDVKLALVLGLFLGWLGLDHVALGMFLGFFLGAVIGILLIALRIRTRKQHVPFAPFLAAGTVIAVLFGEPILRWYTGV